jgi:hypothetical protein
MEKGLDIQGIKDMLDCGEWQHSWYLPKSSYGGTDWMAARQPAYEMIKQMRDSAIQKLCDCQALIKNIEDSFKSDEDRAERAGSGTFAVN